MTHTAVTAITVSYHTGPVLQECLAALAASPDISKIVVVDNGNPPETQTWLRDFASRNDMVELLEPGKNLGFGAGVNLGAAQAQEGHLLLINPDAVIDAGAVPELVTALTPLQQPRIAGGRIYDSAGKECRGTRRRTLTLARALTTFCGWNTWTLENTPAPEGPVSMDAVSGALMLTDTASFRQLAGFDEAYFLHVEDVDLCRRAWEAGGHILYCPQAGALHYGATSNVSSRIVAAHKADSLSYYFQKFSGNALSRYLVKYMLGPFLKLVLMARARN
ncbi:glycosyltransferase family 2 protein [Henriciella sp.]|uniref:glycosyltransferase family 2 protein n=1 Tax=Henriciella sp. TaxID=1968823 RepID=UPI00261AD66B|nr:glycosyltransferase family 2 protein [Henriciella sp.]